MKTHQLQKKSNTAREFKKYIFEPVVIEDKKEITEDNNDFYVDQEIEGATTGKYKSETNKTLKKVKK